MNNHLKSVEYPIATGQKLQTIYIISSVCTYNIYMELAWVSGNVMDCHTTVRGSIPGRNGVFIELHVLRKGQ